MTKGETSSSTYLQCEAGVEYKITYTLVSDPAEALYKLSGQITFEKVETPVDPEPDPEPDPDPTPEYPKTITVKVAAAWEACNLWAWYEDKTNVFEAWPGGEMVKGEDGFYAIDIEINAPVYLIASNNGNPQTGEPTEVYSESTCFDVVDGALVVNENCEYNEPVKPEPIDPYYTIRGLNGDASWSGAGDIDLVFDDQENQWVGLGFTVAEGESFKVIYIDENKKVAGYYAEFEQGCEVGQSYDENGNIILPAGKYDLYFKPGTKQMWINKVDDATTDAEEAIAELIYAIGGTIYAPAPFAIIDLSGKDVTNANGSLEGAYIVKTQNSVTKVLVK